MILLPMLACQLFISSMVDAHAKEVQAPACRPNSTKVLVPVGTCVKAGVSLPDSSRGYRPTFAEEERPYLSTSVANRAVHERLNASIIALSKEFCNEGAAEKKNGITSVCHGVPAITASGVTGTHSDKGFFRIQGFKCEQMITCEFPAVDDGMESSEYYTALHKKEQSCIDAYQKPTSAQESAVRVETKSTQVAH